MAAMGCDGWISTTSAQRIARKQLFATDRKAEHKMQYGELLWRSLEELRQNNQLYIEVREDGLIRRWPVHQVEMQGQVVFVYDKRIEDALWKAERAEEAPGE